VAGVQEWWSNSVLEYWSVWAVSRVTSGLATFWRWLPVLQYSVVPTLPSPQTLMSRSLVSGKKSIPMIKVTRATMMGYQRPA
jgi:hypothetical protein